MQPQQPQVPPAPQQVVTPAQSQNKSSIGSIIGTIIIIAVIILGGLYFWGKRIEEARQKDKLISEPVTTETVEVNEASTIKSVSSGDDVNSIEKDLNNTNLDNLSKELDTPVQ